MIYLRYDKHSFALIWCLAGYHKLKSTYYVRYVKHLLLRAESTQISFQ